GVGAEVRRVPGAGAVPGAHVPGVLRGGGSAGAVGAAVAAGAPRAVPGDGGDDAADPVRLRVLPRADVHRGVPVRAAAVGDAGPGLADRLVRPGAGGAAGQAGRAEAGEGEGEG